MGQHGQVRDGEWARVGDWWVIRERTTKPLGQLKVDANRVLLRGLNGLVSTFEWREGVLCVRSIGCEGDIRLEGEYLIGRVHFDTWASWLFPTLLQDKIRSEIAAGVADAAGTTGLGSKHVFIIHGHNTAARRELATLVSSFGLRPVILDEESERGMTVIEKFEYHAPLCCFAIALLTPDDKVLTPADAAVRWRARQNVIFELGWFMAKLGRARVLVLCQGELESLSDLQGLIFLQFKDSVLEVSPQMSMALRDAGLL